MVAPATTYLAGKSYTWDDIVLACKLLAAGTIKRKDLDETGDDGTLIYKVPRTTLTGKWLKDDHEVMQAKNPPARGVAGEPHWKVELEVRNRRSLDTAGPGTVLSSHVEDQLMLEMSNSAKKGWQYVPHRCCRCRRRRHCCPPTPSAPLLPCYLCNDF